MDHHNTSPTSIDNAGPHPAKFARENGLSVNSQVNPLSFYLQFNHSISHLTPDMRLNGLTSDSSLPELRIPILPCLEEQRLDITEEVAGTVHKAVKRDGKDDVTPESSCYEARRRIEKLKLEPPLLRTDPDYDCCQLARVIRSQREAQLDPDTFPPEQLNAANDEALDFPQSAYQFRDRLDATIQVERIDVPKDTLYCLAKSLQDDWTEDDQRNMLEDDMPHITLTRELTVTPPLSPRERPYSHFVPDDAICRIPIASDPSTLLDNDLAAVEADLFKQDVLQNVSPSAPPLDTPVLSPLGDPPLLSPIQPKISSVKIEGPLTPIDSTPVSLDPSMDLENLAQSVDIDHVLEPEKSNGPSTKDAYNNDDLPFDTLWASLEKNASNLMRDVEQEPLESVNTLARVEIPTMDFSISEPEWRRLPLDAESHLKWILNTYVGFEIPGWQRDRNQERQQLFWSPFLQEPDINLMESIEENGCVEAVLEELVDAPTSAHYVWKQPGWAILREPEDDEIEPPPIPRTEKNLASLVRKRHLELNLPELEMAGPSRSPSPVELIQIPTNLASTPFPFSSTLSNQLPSLLVDCSSASATSTLLSNYVDFHTAKRQKCKQSAFFPTPNHSKSESQNLLTSKPRQPRPEAGRHTAPDTGLQRGITVPTLYPSFNTSDAPSKIIKALTLSRALFSRLERLCPATSIIERDFDRWNTLSWDRNSVSRSPVVSPLAAEADVIVSPATGIIVTTLLKVIQKPPPGHKGQAAIRERVSSAALRYERLIILVSEDNRTDEAVRDLTPFECSAYAEFCGFVAGLDANVQVYYVGGGCDTLSRWLAYYAARHAPEAAKAQELIIQDETSWELFLRRSGMNAFAAQAILGSIKAPDGISEEEARHFGLPAFIRMTPVERLETFKGLMGGERVLSRVNEVIETVWNTNPTW